MAIQYTAADFLSKLSQNNYAYTNSYKKNVREPNEDVETLKMDVTGLKKAVKDIGKSSKNLSLNSGLGNITIYYKKEIVSTKGSTSKTRLEKQFQNLAKTYNSMTEDAENISDADIEKQMKKLEKLFDKNEKDLKKIGFKKKDGKYEFDSDVFSDADNKVLNRLLKGNDSFLRQAEKITRKIETRLEDIQFNTVQRNMTKTTKYDNDEVSLATSFIFAKENVELLGLYGSLIEAGGFSQEYQEDCKKELKYFTDYACNNAEVYKDENYDKMKELCMSKKEELAKIGITFGEGAFGSNTMQYDETKADLSQWDVQSAYLNLFGKDSEFVKKLVECCNKGFHSVIKPEKLGVSIVDVSV